MLGVHQALERLGELNRRLVAVVECHFFAGYDFAETALALGVSERTVQRDWMTARAWLKKELASGEPLSAQSPGGGSGTPRDSA